MTQNPKIAKILDALETSLDVYDAIVKAVLEVGGADEDVHSVVSDKEKLKSIARIVTGAKCDVAPPSIEYYPARTEAVSIPKQAELIPKDFDWVSGLFDGRPWTDAFRLDDRDVPVSPVYGETPFILGHFGRRISSEDAVRWAAANGYRPATVVEAIAFSAAYPDLQRDFHIAALGSFALSDVGIRYVAVLNNHDGRRDLHIGYWYGVDWTDEIRFLFVRQ